MRSFSWRARVSRATESGIGMGTTSVRTVRQIGDEVGRGGGTFEKLQRRTLGCGSCWMRDSARGSSRQGRNVGGHTHVAIADDTPFLRAREEVARSGETFDELLLQTKRVSQELGLPRQGTGD